MKNNHGDVVYTQWELEIIDDYDYDIFGNLLSNEPRDGNPFRYCGEFYDSNSETYYLRNRNYNPRIGRFTTIDPIKDGHNWYAYCSNNPVMFVDPSGSIREPGYVGGVWCENPDAYEFGEYSDTYKCLEDLGYRWIDATESQRKELNNMANEIRRLARNGTPVRYAQDIIMDELHANAELAINYQLSISTGVSGFMYQLGGGNYFEDSISFLIGMGYGEWNYKYNPDWQVPYDYYDGNNMNVDNNKNWRPWMYFDGMLVSADKFGNINLAYVGTKMNLPHIVFQNFTTKDKDDPFWIQYGINMAEQGR